MILLLLWVVESLVILLDLLLVFSKEVLALFKFQQLFWHKLILLLVEKRELTIILEKFNWNLYHPQFVLIDIAVLYSLSKREMISGFAEILKYSLIMNKNSFWLCEYGHEIIDRLNRKTILKAIEISCKSKALIVGKMKKRKG